jgi:RNA polymerase sigma-70 factor (ECF subfamily)
MTSSLPDPESSHAAPPRAQDVIDEFSRQRPRLRRMVEARLDQRLRGRVDPSDILQDVFFDVSRRSDEFVQDPQVPCYVWLRQLTLQQISIAQRRHISAQMRDVRRERSLEQLDTASLTGRLAECLVGQVVSPSSAVNRVEQRTRVQQALTQLKPLDQEILALRHFEELSNMETASVLKMTPRAASNRYVRALVRLRRVLDDQT